MIKNVALASAGILALSTSAAAQEQADFSGFRAEALLGYDRLALDLDPSFEEQSGAEAEGGHESGAFYGAALGYDFTGAGFLLGVDAEFSDSSIGESYRFENEDLFGYLIDGTADLDASRDLYVGGRVGGAIYSTAYYVKAGYSMARFEADLAGTIDGEAVVGSADLDVEGLRLGAGVERHLGGNTFVKLEYRFTNYGQAEVDADSQEVDLDSLFDIIDLDRHQGVVGFGYRF